MPLTQPQQLAVDAMHLAAETCAQNLKHVVDLLTDGHAIKNPFIEQLALSIQLRNAVLYSEAFAEARELYGLLYHNLAAHEKARAAVLDTIPNFAAGIPS